MKRIISGTIAVAMMVVVLCSTALAKSEDVSTYDFSSTSVGAAIVSEEITIMIDGVAYSVPGGAASTVGYGYENDPEYVFTCQYACNTIAEIYENDIIPCPSYCGTEDGIFGPKTYDGILQLQRYTNLSRYVTGWPELVEDGVCGDNTWKQIARMCF